MPDLKNKFNLQEIMGDLKSKITPMVNSVISSVSKPAGHSAPDLKADPSDALGMSLVQWGTAMQALQADYQAQGERLAQMQVLFHDIAAQLQALREEMAACKKGDET